MTDQPTVIKINRKDILEIAKDADRNISNILPKNLTSHELQVLLIAQSLMKHLTQKLGVSVNIEYEWERYKIS